MSVISSAYISRIFCNDCVPHPAPPAEEESGARAPGCLCVVDSNPIKKANVAKCLCVLSLAGESCLQNTKKEKGNKKKTTSLAAESDSTSRNRIHLFEN